MDREPAGPPGPGRPPASFASSLVTQFSGLIVLLGAVLAVPLPLLIRQDEGSWCDGRQSCAPLARFLVLGLVVAAPGIWGLVAAAGLRRRRPWARTAVLATFALYGIAALAGAVATLVVPREPAWGGAVALLVALGVFVRVIRWTVVEHGDD